MTQAKRSTKKAGAKAPAIKAKEAPAVDKMVKAPEKTKALAVEVKTIAKETITATVRDGYAFYFGIKRYLAGESFEIKADDEAYLSQRWKVDIR